MQEEDVVAAELVPDLAAASRKGWDSMSPTVPPISVMITSTPSPAWARMRDLISSVMCGMTCTVSPRYSPRRSLAMTCE